MKNKEYTYLFVDNSLYINLEQNIISLMIYLFFKGKPFNFLERKTNNIVLNQFVFLNRTFRVFEFIYLFNKKRRIHDKSNGIFPTITSNFSGNCLIVLRQGERKIINFRENNVLTYYSRDIGTNTIENRINTIINSQKCNLAPTVINYDIKKRYIREDYINLKTPSYNYYNTKHINNELFPILSKIMTSTNPKVTLLGDYLNDSTKRLNVVMERYENKDSVKEHNIIRICNFLNDIKKFLRSYPSGKEILMVFSHGDFWEGNILRSKSRSKVIDWNTLEVRSAYFDFYFILFHKISQIKEETERIYIVEQIDLLFSNFNVYLKENNIISNSNTLNGEYAEFYRYLFYVESILLKLQEYSEMDSKYLKVVLSWVELLELYEYNMRSKEEQNQLELNGIKKLS
ncbi:hypothetical protein [Alkalihalobacterium chitinilyticum]|uniref:Aminoglycoside phosphotransferase domain-containing protein n=1 Tax=Alkalihalobacterium chitinilyticum TaxID=2980103 RepID=A0ABT5VEB1_9BACI|nr:hypothetical protein [Alkalihalobacterium chitinilyticum]MDE5413801.1 hypothetical protein [Alkalihalobacterium chitinilyticum]